MISELGKRARSAWRFFRMDSIESRNIFRFADQYLRQKGWLESVRHQVSSDPHGEATPWFSYPCLHMLPRVMGKDSRVMEYGGGQSTIWWSKRVAEVVSVDHDREWHARIAGQLDTPLLLREAGHALEPELEARLAPFYELELADHTTGDLEQDMRSGAETRPFHAYAAEMMRHPRGYFDIAVVDGAARVLCAWVAAQCLGENGIVILDNSDVAIFDDAFKILEDAGFVGLEFAGPTGVIRYENTTTIFVRNLSVVRKRFPAATAARLASS